VADSELVLEPVEGGSDALERHSRFANAGKHQPLSKSHEGDARGTARLAADSRHDGLAVYVWATR
jgi:hypothetical protein